MRSEYKKSVIVASIGTAVFVLGLIIFLSFPALFKFVLNHELPLKPDSTSFKTWKDIPFPLYFSVYVFNVTNPDDFLNNGSVPNLQQLGPYTYRAFWTKNSIVWNPNDTVSFRENHVCYFSKERSGGSEDDVVTTLNGPLVITANMFRNAPVWEKAPVSMFLRFLKEKLFIQRTVRQLLFEGYDDLLTSLAPLINPNFPDMKGKFRWLYGKNGTDDGLFTAFTGKGDMSNFNVIDRWNGQKYLNYWKGDTCNMMNGTNGEVNPPLEEDQRTLRFFRTDTCRSWTLTYSKNIDHHGLLSKRFVTTRDVLANGTENPDNECFTIDKELPSGAYDANTCLYDTPTVLSLPHFYLGDSSYTQAVEGLSPNESLHDFYLDVEPISGVTVGLTARLQLNVHLRKIEDIVIFKDLPVESIVFPVLWQEIVAAVDDDQAKDLIGKLYMPKYYVGISCYCLFAIGGLVSLIAGIFIIYSWFRIKQELDDDDSLIDNDDEEPYTNGRVRKEVVDAAEDSPILQP